MISKSDAFRPEGHIRLRLTDRAGHVLDDKTHNLIVNAAKRMALAKSLAFALIPNTGSPFGMMETFGADGWDPYISSGGFATFDTLPNAMQLVLLNMPSSAVINNATKVLPIYDSNGAIDYTKVIGYAGCRAVSSNSREGIIDTSGAFVMNSFDTAGLSWYFDTDIATGQFNAVAIMPGFESKPMRGLLTFKCLSAYNTRITGDTNSFGFILPGVTDGTNVVTGPNEIMLFFTHNTKNRWKYNIVTGEMKAVDPTDFAYTFTVTNFSSQYVWNMLTIGEYVYLLSGKTLYRIKISDGTSTSLSVAYDTGFGKGLWYDGEFLYVSSLTDGTTAARAYVMKINPTTMKSVSSTTNDNYTEWGGLPARWTKSHTCIGKAGSTWLVYNNDENVCIECTDISNVLGTMTAILPGEAFNSFMCNEKLYHIYQGTTQTVQIGTETGASSFTPSGVWLADDTASNFWSYALLSETKNKDADTKAYIDYGYQMDESSET